MLPDITAQQFNKNYIPRNENAAASTLISTDSAVTQCATLSLQPSPSPQNKRKRKEGFTDDSIEISNKKLKPSANSTPKPKLSEEEIKNNCLELLKRQSQEEEKALTSKEPVKFETYERYTRELHDLKSEIQFNEDFFEKASPEETIDKIEYLLEIVNFQPVTAEAMEFELTILNNIELVCTRFSRSRNLDLKLFSEEVLMKLNDKIYPDITYNNASLVSEKTAQEIKEIRLENRTCADEKKRANWNSITELLKSDLARFNLAYKKLDLDSPFSTYALKAVGACYEELGDCFLDSFSDFPIDKHCEKLTHALSNYFEALAIYEHLEDNDKIRDIELSILNVRYEYATVLNERDGKTDQKEALKQFKEISQYVKLHLNGKITDKNFVLVFYKFACLQEHLKRTSDKAKALQFAQNFWKICSKDPFLNRSSTGSNYEVLGWLNQFAPIFQITPALTKNLNIPNSYSMCKFGEANWLEQRKQQLLKGLKLLTESNFSASYSINLREHQIEAFRSISKSIEEAENQGGYLHLPTGSGKTYIMLMQTLATQMPTLIVVPNILLMDQTIENIKKISPKTKVSRYDGKAKDRFEGQILVTTYQSLEADFNRKQPRISLKEFGLVWADEAHSCLTKDRSTVINELKKSACVIGLTATDSFNTKRVNGAAKHASEVFGKCYFEVDLETLIQNKILCPFKNVIVNSSHILMRPTRKNPNHIETDFNESELSRLLNNEAINNSVADIYLNEVDPETGVPIFGKSALAFCCGIEHAESVVKTLNAKLPGRNSRYPWAACIHSKVSRKKQVEIIQLHKEGKIPILVGDKIFNEGYDNPADEIGFLLRPTKSDVLETQRGGRFLRPKEGKSHALIFEWKYPGLENQIFFYEEVNGKRWVGIQESENQSKPQLKERKREGYSIDWSKDIPAKIDPLKIAIEEQRLQNTLTPTNQKFNSQPADLNFSLSATKMHASPVPSSQSHNLAFLHPTKNPDCPKLKSKYNPAFPNIKPVSHTKIKNLVEAPQQPKKPIVTHSQNYARPQQIDLTNHNQPVPQGSRALHPLANQINYPNSHFISNLSGMHPQYSTQHYPQHPNSSYVPLIPPPRYISQNLSFNLHPQMNTANSESEFYLERNVPHESSNLDSPFVPDFVPEHSLDVPKNILQIPEQNPNPIYSQSPAQNLSPVIKQNTDSSKIFSKKTFDNNESIFEFETNEFFFDFEKGESIFGSDVFPASETESFLPDNTRYVPQVPEVNTQFEKNMQIDTFDPLGFENGSIFNFESDISPDDPLYNDINSLFN